VSIPESVRTSMQQTNALFGAAVVKNREIDALNNVYTADARILPPGADLIQGRAQIKDFWKQGYRESRSERCEAEYRGRRRRR
jgi:ketosteroid isomerase-like protein